MSAQPVIPFTSQNPRYFYDTNDFPQLLHLERNFESIKKELLKLREEKPSDAFWFKAFPHYVNSESEAAWNTFTFLFFGIGLNAHKKLCPETWAQLSRVPELVSADFSFMKPHTHIKPHRGFTNKVLRVHLGLIVPKGCWLRVGDTTRKWEEGKLMIFDDSFEHEAMNPTGEDRVVLMFDIPNPQWGLSAEAISRERIYNMTDKFMLEFLSKEQWIGLYEKGSFD